MVRLSRQPCVFTALWAEESVPELANAARLVRTAPPQMSRCRGRAAGVLTLEAWCSGVGVRFQSRLWTAATRTRVLLYSNCPHHDFLSRKYPPAGQVRHFLLGAGTLTGTGPVLTVRGCQRGCAAPRHLLPLPVAVPLNQDASGPGPRRWQGHLGPVRGSSCRAGSGPGGRGPGRWRWLQWQAH